MATTDSSAVLEDANDRFQAISSGRQFPNGAVRLLRAQQMEAQTTRSLFPLARLSRATSMAAVARSLLAAT